jgi:putative ABC transport system permease protein
MPVLVNTVIFNAAPSDVEEIKAALLSAQNVDTIQDKSRILQGYKDLLEPFSAIYYVLGIMAVCIGFSVIYNISRVSLSERSRELATMRVLGMSVSETNEVITFEHWLLCLFAVAGGIPMAFAMRGALAGVFDSDVFSIPTTTPNSAIILSALGSMLSVWLANRSVGKTIAKFDLVDVLKERE